MTAPRGDRKEIAESIEAAIQPAVNPAGFAVLSRERAGPVNLPPWFIDRCRQAYLSIDFDARDRNRIIAVSSAQHGAGKTSVAVGIATAIAVDTADRTLLIECDFASQVGFDALFDLRPGPGLCEWMESGGRLRIIHGNPIFVLPTGDPGPDPSRMMYRMGEMDLLSAFRPHFRNIVVDLPPLLNIAYASLASRIAEHVLLVARYGVTALDDLERAVFLLGRERLAGIVLNDHDPKTPNWLQRLI